MAREYEKATDRRLDAGMITINLLLLRYFRKANSRNQESDILTRLPVMLQYTLAIAAVVLILAAKCDVPSPTVLLPLSKHLGCKLAYLNGDSDNVTTLGAVPHINARCRRWGLRGLGGGESPIGISKLGDLEIGESPLGLSVNYTILFNIDLKLPETAILFFAFLNDTTGLGTEFDLMFRNGTLNHLNGTEIANVGDAEKTTINDQNENRREELLRNQIAIRKNSTHTAIFVNQHSAAVEMENSEGVGFLDGFEVRGGGIVHTLIVWTDPIPTEDIFLVYAAGPYALPWDKSNTSCDTLTASDPIVCNGHGTCTGPENDTACECDDLWMNPTCGERNFSRLLEIEEGKYNALLERNRLDSATFFGMSNRIVELESNLNATVGCQPGYMNYPACDMYIRCNGIPINHENICNGHGTCVALNSCICFERFERVGGGVGCKEICTDVMAASGHCTQ